MLFWVDYAFQSKKVDSEFVKSVSQVGSQAWNSDVFNREKWGAEFTKLTQLEHWLNSGQADFRSSTGHHYKGVANSWKLGSFYKQYSCCYIDTAVPPPMTVSYSRTQPRLQNITHQSLLISNKAFRHFHIDSCHSCRARQGVPPRAPLHNLLDQEAAPWSE